MPSWKKLITSGSDAAIPSISTIGDFTIDAGGDIVLDADGTDILLKDGGTEFGSFKRASSDFIIKSATNDKDIVFKGEDNSSTITALTLDMSDAGHALFTGNISGSTIRASGDVIAFKVNKIGGYEFDWNDKQDVYEGHDIGVIAQEVQKVLPEVVGEKSDGYLGVKYEKIVPLLIESIKDLSKKTKKLEREIKRLKHKK